MALKKVGLTEDGEIDVAVPRDCNSTFKRRILHKGDRWVNGFDERIVCRYGQYDGMGSMTVRGIRRHLQELYGIEASPDLISRVPEAMLEEARNWQNDRLMHPIQWCSSMRSGSKSATRVWSATRRPTLCWAIAAEADKKLLGLWIKQIEGARSQRVSRLPRRVRKYMRSPSQ